MSKTLIVTGASRGIGLAIAQYLLREKHNVVVIARSKEPLEELRSRYPNQVRVIAGDMADFAIAKKATELTLSEFGQIDGLIVNHGILEPAVRVAEGNVEDWKKGYDVNFFSAVAFAQAIIPELRNRKGCIMFTSSGGSVGHYSTWGFYGSSKAALNHLAGTLSTEEPDITSLSIAPGVVDTEMQRVIREEHALKMTKEEGSRFHTLHKEGKLLRPEQPGNVMARMVLNPPKELSGKYLRWNDESLVAFQDK